MIKVRKESVSTAQLRKIVDAVKEELDVAQGKGQKTLMMCGLMENEAPHSINLFAEHYAKARCACEKLQYHIFDQCDFEKIILALYRDLYVKDDDQHKDDLYTLLAQSYGVLFQQGYIESIVFLPGYEKSVIAQWFMERAEHTGVRVYYLSSMWLRSCEEA